MSPKKGAGHPSHGRGRELQALLDSSVERVADKDDAAGQIPWRTSRRLQEATFRSLTKESRDAETTSSPESKEKLLPKMLSSHVNPLKSRQLSPSSHLDISLTEESESEEAAGEECSGSDYESKKDLAGYEESVSKKRKRKTVHFAEPLFVYIEDRKSGLLEEFVRKPVLENRAARQSRATEKALSPPSQPKLPMSCFDLLCKFSGAKGWRCYRSCIDGESYCNYHISGRKSPSLARISLCS